MKNLKTIFFARYILQNYANSATDSSNSMFISFLRIVIVTNIDIKRPVNILAHINLNFMSDVERVNLFPILLKWKFWGKKGILTSWYWTACASGLLQILLNKLEVSFNVCCHKMKRWKNFSLLNVWLRTTWLRFKRVENSCQCHVALM